MKHYLLATLENSRNYTLSVAESMPGNEYSFTPAPGTWSFHEQMEHISYGIHWWMENYIHGNKTEWSPVPAAKSKNEVINRLADAYSDLQKTIQEANINEDILKGFAATLDHITHHRGQAIVYLRSKGIPAPEYVY